MTGNRAFVRPSAVHTWPAVFVTNGLWIGTLLLLLAGAGIWTLVCGLAAMILSLTSVSSRLLRHKLMAITVLGSSMEPTLYNGDRVLIRRGSFVRPGQVVVLDQSEPNLGGPYHSWIIKRVIAAPGDPVPRDRIAALADVPEQHVPPGKLVLLGDNPTTSTDSRVVGYFPSKNVAGTMLRVLGRRRGH